VQEATVPFNYSYWMHALKTILSSILCPEIWRGRNITFNTRSALATVDAPVGY
jgi:hypothetical protein